MVRGKGEENAQGRHDLGQYLMLVVGYLRFQALANLTRPITVQFSNTYIMGTTGVGTRKLAKERVSMGTAERSTWWRTISWLHTRVVVALLPLS